MVSDTSDTGAIAESYVYYRLLSWGYAAHFASGIGCVFDLWVPNDTGGIIKIQVKGTDSLSKRKNYKTKCYRFRTAKYKMKRYTPEEVDVLALVAIPEELCIFSTRLSSGQRRISRKKFTSRREAVSWEKALEALKGGRNGSTDSRPGGSQEKENSQAGP